MSGRKAASSLHQTSHYAAVDIRLVNEEQTQPSSFGPANCLEVRVLHCRGAAALFQLVVRNSTHSTGGYDSDSQHTLRDGLEVCDWSLVSAVSGLSGFSPFHRRHHDRSHICIIKAVTRYHTRQPGALWKTEYNPLLCNMAQFFCHFDLGNSCHIKAIGALLCMCVFLNAFILSWKTKTWFRMTGLNKPFGCFCV